MPRKKQNEAALIVGQFILDAMRANSQILLGTNDAASSAGDVMLCIAIWIGQHELRPMTAASLATFIGMPRPTAIRRLHYLSERKLVARDDAGRWSMSAGNPNENNIIGMIDTNLKRFRQACGKVSILDSKPIDGS